MSGLIAVLDILFVFLQGIQNKQTSDYRDHRRNIQIISDADPIKQIAADDAFQDRSYIQGKTHSAASRRSSSRLPAPANTVRSDFLYHLISSSKAFTRSFRPSSSASLKRANNGESISSTAVTFPL